MRHSNNIQNRARHHVGLVLALVGLTTAVATLMPGLARLASAQAAASWSYTGNLNAFRDNHTATQLQNGKVLVAGGAKCHTENNVFVCQYFDSAELYDPATGTWSSTGNLNTARADHTATLLPNGKVLVVMGGNNSGILNSAELYDPATGTWSYTGNLNTARFGHTATLLLNGKVLVAGGVNNWSLNTAELYDPATGAWSSTDNLRQERFNHTATLLPNGKVLVVGGEFLVGAFDGANVVTDSAEIYDPATGTWTNTGNLNIGRTGHTATLLLSGKVLVAGGAVEPSFNTTNSAELYDQSTGTWSYTGNLITDRILHKATLLPNGKVLVAGDINTPNSAELYDPATGTWNITANLNTGRARHTATLLPNGKVLVAGGTNADNTLNTTELYDSGTSASNQIDDPQFFVRQHYLDFLNREPDQKGLDFWITNITSCGVDTHCVEVKRIDTSAAFFLSIEFQETGYLVYRIYKSAYGNLPGAPVPVRLNEFLPDTQQIGHGIVVGVGDWQTQLEANKQTFVTNFVARSRFSTDYPFSMTPAEFVDTMLISAGISPPMSERAAIINEFGSAATSEDSAARARVLRRVAENSTLKQQEFNRAFVLMQYFGYLRRNPNDPPDHNFDGYNFWLSKLDQFHGNFVEAEMVKAFLSSIEYRQRFGPP